ncbi:MAG: 3' terminal RNA ribose 2'-O-methyltransferase Hen1 [Candidatus Electrothrix scaldis]|nr:MAG: 3' terminal RNA ribose 2'-O-methyltransferase Hen1 [Candidatus Electrothrix sp. GW3-3]
MLLTITTTHTPATDLGFLLHKHPDKVQAVDLAIGKAHIFYPEASEEKTTAALLLDVDPIELVRGARNLAGKGFSLGQYVNDRPYVASSFLSVALSKAFSTAMNGRCSAKPELVDQPMPFHVRLSVLPAPRGGALLIKKMFEPLGYRVELKQHILDDQFTEWGKSRYFTLDLFHTITLHELLSHLYVLIPALDNDKHYFVNQDEIDKLLAKGQGWLAAHPEKEQITRRYLINLGSLSRQALKRLTEEEEEQEQEITTEEKERQDTLNQKRIRTVLEELKKTEAKTVLDLGCGEGKLIRALLKEKQFVKITGTDISYTTLCKAKERLHWDQMAPKQQERLEIFQGSLLYRDKRFASYDAAVVMEVIEHLDANRLQDFERVVFACATPQTVLLTTPNREYNVLFEGMEPGTLRHPDHRFEWTRQEFETWAQKTAKRYNYTVEFRQIGEIDEKIGGPTQMGIFTHGN